MVLYYFCVMIDNREIESGFVIDPVMEFGVQTGMNDVEILHVSKINIIARGRRYGRLWLLKGLREELRDSAPYRRQLQKEFEIHSRLCHPGVVQAVGFENIPGLGFCIIEKWIEGKTLADLLREGVLAYDERQKILLEIITSAGYLHSMGVVHRDLKPANVMIRNVGKSVVLIDFGLADTDDYVELKQAAGTRGFISPEQYAENRISISNDIYSIGVIMKELMPEYASIARKCTAELNERPKDTDELIKLINQRVRRPKVIWISAIIIGVLLSVFFVILHIISLSESARDAKLSISEAQKAANYAQNSAIEAQQKVILLNETNSKQEDRVSKLQDSLNNVTENYAKSQNELHRMADYTVSREKAAEEGRKKIDNMIADYDRRVFSKFNELSPACDNAINEMHSKSQEIIDKSCDLKKYPDLTDADCEEIKNNIYAYYLKKFSVFHKKFLKRFYPEAIE